MKIYETITADISHISNEQWLVLARDLAIKKFSPASASILNEATAENFEEMIVQAFINEILLEACMEKVRNNVF